METQSWTPKVGDRVIFTYPLLGWHGAAGVVMALENQAQVVVQFDHDGSTMHLRPWHLQPEPVAAPEVVPASLDFRDRPAKFWLEGDIVRLGGDAFRVTGVTHSDVSLRIAFSLRPIGGGAVIVRSFMPGDFAPVARGV